MHGRIQERQRPPYHRLGFLFISAETVVDLFLEHLRRVYRGAFFVVVVVYVVARRARRPVLLRLLALLSTWHYWPHFRLVHSLRVETGCGLLDGLRRAVRVLVRGREGRSCRFRRWERHNPAPGWLLLSAHCQVRVVHGGTNDSNRGREREILASLFPHRGRAEAAHGRLGLSDGGDLLGDGRAAALLTPVHAAHDEVQGGLQVVSGQVVREAVPRLREDAPGPLLDVSMSSQTGSDPPKWGWVSGSVDERALLQVRSRALLSTGGMPKFMDATLLSTP